jgi:hypothetical protein
MNLIKIVIKQRHSQIFHKTMNENVAGSLENRRVLRFRIFVLVFLRCVEFVA